MLALFLSPPYMPFSIAFLIMLGIGLIEAIGLGLGHLDLHADSGGSDADLDGGVLDWLGLGDLPILVWLTSLLACFSVIGIAGQQVATVVLGAPLPALLASGAAAVGGLLLNSVAASGLARIIPGFESTAIASSDLVRLRGTVLEGNASRGHPARAKVVDRHGQAHYVMVEPHDDDAVIGQGETGLLVRREGALFFVVTDLSALRTL